MIKSIRLFVYVPDKGDTGHMTDHELASYIIDHVEKPLSPVEPLDIEIKDASPYESVRLTEFANVMQQKIRNLKERRY